MKYILFVIGLVLVFSNIGAANEECDAFRNHLRDVYYKKLDQPENRAEELRFQDDLIKQAKVFGYALSNQLQYIKRGSLHEVFYKKCVKRAREEIKKLAIEIKKSKNWSDEFTKTMETQALREFETATHGFYDTEMAKFTGVKMKDAPDYFLARGRTGIQAGNQAQNQTGTGEPGVHAGAPPPARPDALGLDRVAGDYTIYDHTFPDKPLGTLRVRGTMDEATFDFQIVYQGRLQWHWKGTLTWIRGQAGKVRRLRGPGHNQLHRQSENCWMRIEKGADNTWRAIWFNLGGNNFKLVPR